MSRNLDSPSKQTDSEDDAPGEVDEGYEVEYCHALFSIQYSLECYPKMLNIQALVREFQESVRPGAPRNTTAKELMATQEKAALENFANTVLLTTTESANGSYDENLRRAAIIALTFWRQKTHSSADYDNLLEPAFKWIQQGAQLEGLEAARASIALLVKERKNEAS